MTDQGTVEGEGSADHAVRGGTAGPEGEAEDDHRHARTDQNEAGEGAGGEGEGRGLVV